MYTDQITVQNLMKEKARNLKNEMANLNTLKMFKKTEDAYLKNQKDLSF